MTTSDKNNEFVNSNAGNEFDHPISDQKTPVNVVTLPVVDVSPDAGTVIPTTPNGLKNTIIDNLVPSDCPVCGSQLSWKGVHLVCKSDKCIAKLITSISYFYSKSGIQINGLAEQTIEKLLYIPECYIVLRGNPWALLDITSYDIYFAVSKTLGKKTFANLQKNVSLLSGKKTIAHFISGLGMPGLAYKTTLRLCQYLKSGKLNIPIPAIAQKNFILAVQIYNDAANEMKHFNFAPLPSPAKAIYCITGVLSMSRDAMIEQLSGYGYEFSSSVTREVNYLIVGEEPGKIKRDRAEQYNIPQITEVQLNKIIQGG